MKVSQTIGSRIADLLIHEGVDKLFTLPEVTFGDIHNRFVEREGRIIAGHHETACAYMAESYAQSTGNIAVTGGNCGPGASNLLPAVVHSDAEGLPVLYLGSERGLMARSSVRSPKFQCPNLVDMVKPVTKFAAILEHPEQVDELFYEAFRQMRYGRPGPVYLGLPFDMLREEYEFEALPAKNLYRPARIMPPSEDIKRVADILESAELPVLMPGAGVRISKTHELLQQLAEILKCPVVRTYGGRGTFPDTHSQVLDFGFGPGLEATQQADVILVVGSSIGEKLMFGDNLYFSEQEGFGDFFGSDQTWIQVEKDPQVAGRNRLIDIALVGNIEDIIPELISELKLRQVRGCSEKLAVWQEQRRDIFQGYIEAAKDITPVHPGRLILEAQKSIPDDAIIVSDGGSIFLWQQRYLNNKHSNFLATLKMGMLGVGLPYAIGAQLAEPGKRVCLVTGDGAIGFYMMEFETAVRYQLPVVIVVAYDQGWALEVPYYEYRFGKTFEVDNEFVRMDRLAMEMGGHGEFCQTTDEIQPAMDRAFASGKPAIVQIVMDRRISAYEAPEADLIYKWHADKVAYI
ncbi:thiamine pyrophosphate-binding protein [Zhongshania aquimaris]|uniref:Thiamine pyrophosphate-binding protein n=1 Tax=Zhongshania aquimaris TaxID=2857107 RepID=A0ABS6VWZ7_9GAMM|nr:thiamine pyrophosphate-binding protein [Zhongshania aquimaris]MBW2942205.1 thiamine pyrophosphate-binding protein [Zhongshania aquimaris]